MLNIIHDTIVLKGTILGCKGYNEYPTFGWDEGPHKRASKK